jgi:hypothetical protein
MTQSKKASRNTVASFVAAIIASVASVFVIYIFDNYDLVKSGDIVKASPKQADSPAFNVPKPKPKERIVKAVSHRAEINKHVIEPCMLTKMMVDNFQGFSKGGTLGSDAEFEEIMSINNGLINTMIVAIKPYVVDKPFNERLRIYKTQLKACQDGVIYGKVRNQG